MSIDEVLWANYSKKALQENMTMFANSFFNITRVFVAVVIIICTEIFYTVNYVDNEMKNKYNRNDFTMPVDAQEILLGEYEHMNADNNSEYHKAFSKNTYDNGTEPTQGIKEYDITPQESLPSYQIGKRENDYNTRSSEEYVMSYEHLNAGIAEKVNVIRNHVNLMEKKVDNNDIVKPKFDTPEQFENSDKRGRTQFDRTQLSSDDAKKYFTHEDVNYTFHQVDAEVFQSVPLLHQIPDSRPKVCVNQSYMYHLPPSSVSIIIPFYNELWASLVRSLYSILDRTPLHLIKEIILIDDCSTMPNLLDPLEHFLSSLPDFIRVHRLKQREGLIRARVIGAQLAVADILVFLDAHIIVNTGWLEPLINVINQNNGTVAMPVVENISPQTAEYEIVHKNAKGTFTWELDFEWRLIPDDPSTNHLPFETSTMIGCAFSVQRDFFLSHGSLDTGMNVWGGENLELIIRTWMCGGDAKIVPCSRIGHVYRSLLPYQFSRDILFKNLQRLALVWMDDYVKYYYMTTNRSFNMTQEESSSLLERKRLREHLQCKSFSWFLQTVATDVVVPPDDAVLFGQLKNVNSSLCVYLAADWHVYMVTCFTKESYTAFAFDSQKHIYSIAAQRCLVPNALRTSGSFTPLHITDCNGRDDAAWLFSHVDPCAFGDLVIGIDNYKPVGLLRLSSRPDLCLSQRLLATGEVAVGVSPCLPDSPEHYWMWTHRINGAYPV